MHPAPKLQFERTVREFAQSRAVPEADRSPAPAWWWQPAIVGAFQAAGPRKRTGGTAARRRGAWQRASPSRIELDHIGEHQVV
jgi:hypothetical protein